MKFEMKMTQRDKKLLIFLAVFVIVVGIGYWGVYPQIKETLEIEKKISKEEIKKEADDVKLVELPMLEKDNQILEENIAKERENFFSMMTSDQVDKYITGMVLDYELEAYSLTIKMPTKETSLKAYKNSEKYAEDLQKEKEAEKDRRSSKSSSSSKSNSSYDVYDTNASVAVAATENNAGLVGMYHVQISLELGGEQEDLQKFLDDLFEVEDKIWVKSYSWKMVREVRPNEETKEVELVLVPRLTLELNLYMCEK